jgi:hypothetical protein
MPAATPTMPSRRASHHILSLPRLRHPAAIDTAPLNSA